MSYYDDYDPYEGPTGFMPGQPLPGDPAHVRILCVNIDGLRLVMRRSYPVAKAQAYCDRLNALQRERDEQAFRDEDERAAHEEEMIADSIAAYDAALAEEYARMPPPACWDCGVLLTGENSDGSSAICRACYAKACEDYATPRGDEIPW